MELLESPKLHKVAFLEFESPESQFFVITIIIFLDWNRNRVKAGIAHAYKVLELLFDFRLN